MKHDLVSLDDIDLTMAIGDDADVDVADVLTDMSIAPPVPAPRATSARSPRHTPRQTVNPSARILSPAPHPQAQDQTQAQAQAQPNWAAENVGPACGPSLEISVNAVRTISPADNDGKIIPLPRRKPATGHPHAAPAFAGRRDDRAEDAPAAVPPLTVELHHGVDLLPALRLRGLRRAARPGVDAREMALTAQIEASTAAIALVSGVFEPVRALRMVRNLAARFPVAAYRTTTGRCPLGCGQLILSTQPVRDTRFLPLPALPDEPERLIERGILSAIVDHAGAGPVRIAILECAPGLGGRHGWRRKRRQDQYLSALRDALASLTADPAGGDIPLLLAGATDSEIEALAGLEPAGAPHRLRLMHAGDLRLTPVLDQAGLARGPVAVATSAPALAATAPAPPRQTRHIAPGDPPLAPPIRRRA
jgi:hypothetical protein